MNLLNTLLTLIGSNGSTSQSTTNKQRIVNISHYPLYPSNYGGSIRVLNVNRACNAAFDVQYFSLTLKTPFKSVDRNRGFSVQYFFCFFYSLTAAPLWLMKLPYNFLLGFPFLLGPIPRKMRKAINSADLIVIEEPHLFYWVHRKYPHKKFLLNQHNVEFDIENNNDKLKPYFLHHLAVKTTFRIEDYAVQHATHITAVSPDDIERLQKLYKLPTDKMSLVANGCDSDLLKDTISVLPDTLPPTIQKIIEGKKVVVFIGSDYKPNRDALQYIECKISPRLKTDDVIFIVIGRVGESKAGTLERNIYYTGLVDDIRPFLKRADIAINPMLTGSGTNIKVMEYVGAGIPTISTPFGLRGIPIPTETTVISDIDDFAQEIMRLLDDEQRRTFMSTSGNKYVQKNLTWESISNKYCELIGKII